MRDRGSLAMDVLQAQMDKLVSEKLGTLKGEFPVKQLEGDMFQATEMILDMMENSAGRFLAEMRERLKSEREKSTLRIKVRNSE